MQRSYRALVAAILFTAGVVVTAPHPGGAQDAPAPSPAASGAAPSPADPAYQHAREECMQHAARETETVSPQSQATKAAIGIYVECMKAKGFPVQRR